ncbi:CsxC family protein [Neobacillus massiliamazoniensis]
MDPPGPCSVTPTPLTPFTSANTATVAGPIVHRIKVPVVLAEPTIQIPLETTIALGAMATEIKRVKKNVFLDQVKIVPEAPFTRVDGTDFFTFQRAKLFIAGHIRKNIEFTTAGATVGACTVSLSDRVVDIPFTGFTELSVAAGTLINRPILGINETSESSFLSDTNNLNARLDKFFFNNLVKFNEQPFGELVAANFFELDFATPEPAAEGTFSTLTEKLVLELTVKVLQTQQLAVALTTVVPNLPGLTPPM